MASVDNISIRALSDADLPQAHALSLALDWPHRLEDWRVSLEGGRGLAAVVEQPGDAPSTLAGVIIWWQYEEVGALGTLIVAPQFQRRGLGRRLVQAVLDEADDRDVRSLRLHATAEGASLYESMGFVDDGSIQQYQGVLLPGRAKPTIAGGVIVREMQAGDERALRSLDQRAWDGGDRSHLLSVLQESSTVRRVAVSVDDGRIVGYALCRPFGHGSAIGPLVASSDDIALTLLSHTAAALNHAFIRVDLTEPIGSEMQQWLTAAGLPPTDRVRSLTRGDPVRGEEARIYALASQAMC